MSESKRSAYATLGLRPDATHQQVHEAYRRLAKVVHPDAGGDRHMFDELRSAYELLTEAELAEQGGRASPQGTSTRASRHRPQRDSRGTLARIGTVFYWLISESVTFWAVLIGVPAISMWALYNNHPTAAITVGAISVALASAGWWFLRRRC